MTVLQRKRIAEAALKAAHEAVVDAGEADAQRKEVGTLNEQWVQSYVGILLNDSLRRMETKTRKSAFENVLVTFETTVSWLDSFFEYEPPIGRGYKIGSRKRFDLCLWGQGRFPIGLVEIKNDPNQAPFGIKNDINKLRKAILRYEKLKFGMFLFSVRYNNIKLSDVSKRIDEIIGPFRRRFSKSIDFEMVDSREHMEEGHRCIWVCAILTRK